LGQLLLKFALRLKADRLEIYGPCGELGEGRLRRHLGHSGGLGGREKERVLQLSLDGVGHHTPAPHVCLGGQLQEWGDTKTAVAEGGLEEIVGDLW
jgi:hypothetical protein